MTNRVVAADVTAILDNTALTDVEVEVYITSANALVNQALSGAGLSETILKEIERYVAAHLISVTRERVAEREGAGGAFINYTGKYGGGLESTGYGQTAIAMDTTGQLAALSGKAVEMFAITGYDR